VFFSGRQRVTLTASSDNEGVKRTVDWLLVSSSIGNEFDVSAVVDSYRSALDAAEKAA